MFLQNSEAFHPFIFQDRLSCIWLFVKSTTMLALNTDLIGIDQGKAKEIVVSALAKQESLNFYQCIDWFDKLECNNQTLSKDTFECILITLDSVFSEKLLKINHFHRVSPHLLTIFGILNFYPDLIKTLQSMLNRSNFTFEFLTVKYLKSLSERNRINHGKRSPQDISTLLKLAKSLKFEQ